MPRCGATLDETSVPLGQEVTPGGVNEGTTHPGAARPLSLRATPPERGFFLGAARNSGANERQEALLP